MPSLAAGSPLHAQPAHVLSGVEAEPLPRRAAVAKRRSLNMEKGSGAQSGSSDKRFTRNPDPPSWCFHILATASVVSLATGTVVLQDNWRRLVAPVFNMLEETWPARLILFLFLSKVPEPGPSEALLAAIVVYAPPLGVWRWLTEVMGARGLLAVAFPVIICFVYWTNGFFSACTGAPLLPRTCESVPASKVAKQAVQS
eukprot:gnl/TRDRNA2_/TRDRNA2_173879_c7_seq21.p2 gnl/TRDRNA2_/TRDRNA2_173879_c7~~gnl/TRDRNA2_/TRDRNA2_173879_c7_seq21.p2  ORF type:complete len:212 (+),score=19.32 gnl/TRDRNA2_/TRDRNA2_173879_c7_seq21:40-636(+)